MTTTPVNLFCSYAPADTSLFLELVTHLAALERRGIICAWHDRRIGGGDDRYARCNEYIDQAQIILLLVSADFVASDYCYDVELRRALERRLREAVHVIPIVLRACDWHSTPFGRLQSLPADGKPVASWASRDEAWADVVSGIRAAVANLSVRAKVHEQPSEYDDRGTLGFQAPPVRTLGINHEGVYAGMHIDGYRFETLLGSGNVSSVWKAKALRSGRNVVIKVLKDDAAYDRLTRHRFRREARAISLIDSPRIRRLVEVIEWTDNDALVFEFLSGESLGERMCRSGRLAISELRPIVDDVLQGLIAAHDAGVIHAGLTPDGIFLVDGGGHPGRAGERSKILDFGFSRIAKIRPDDATVTDLGASPATMAYGAPEQLPRPASIEFPWKVDERTDLYSVGMIIFAALSGGSPFRGSIERLEHKHPRLLKQITGTQWPDRLESFLQRVLSYRPDHRFTTAAQMLDLWRAVTARL